MKKENKVLAAVGMAALVVGAGVGAVAHSAFSEPTVITTTETITVPEVQVKEVVKEVVVENPVNVDLQESVEELSRDNLLMESELEMFKRVFQSAEDREIFDDAEEFIEEVLAEDKALAKAVAFIQDNERDLFDLLEDEGLVADEDEVELRKVYGDIEDVKVLESDFDEDYYEFKIPVKIDDEELDDTKIFQVVVEYDEGELEFVKAN